MEIDINIKEKIITGIITDTKEEIVDEESEVSNNVFFALDPFNRVIVGELLTEKNIKLLNKYNVNALTLSLNTLDEEKFKYLSGFPNFEIIKQNPRIFTKEVVFSLFSHISGLDKTALVLIIIGAINWGLIGFFKFDLVAAIFGQMSALSRIIYALVGLSGLWGVKLLFED